MQYKYCDKCHELKLLSEYHLYYSKRRGGYYLSCIKCDRLNNQKYKERHKHEAKYWEMRHMADYRKRRKLRDLVLSHYCPNGVIQCADLFGLHSDEIIRDMDVLTIDHINGGGLKEVRKYGAAIYERLKRNGFPKGYQVLCWNCQMKKVILNGEKKKKTNSVT